MRGADDIAWRLAPAAFAAAILFAFGLADVARAQSPPPDYAFNNRTPSDKPTREGAYAAGGWLFYPGLFTGLVYNSNINQTESGKVSGLGERITPSFSAKLDNGIHQSELYGLLDVQNYSDDSVVHKTTTDAKAGFVQSYEARRDLTFRFSGDFTRQLDVFGGSAFAQPGSALAVGSSEPSATAVSPQVSPDRYDQFTGSISAQKALNRAFVNVGFSAQRIVFDKTSATASSRDGTVYTAFQRTGFYVTPQTYAFVDSSLDWRRMTDTTRDSNGYRVTAGLGTARTEIWTGEVYGGYQAEKNDTVGTYDGTVAGVRLIYSPTRFWTMRLNVDETLGASLIAGSVGTASRVTDALFNVGYNGMPVGWTANGRLGFVHTSFVNSTRVDDGWLAGANVGYNFWRGLGATLDYQFKTVNSNVAGQSFDQHLVSLGVTYKN